MSESSPVVASRAKRFLAYALDQTFLSIIGCIVFVAVFATQAQPISNAINAFFDDPLWRQSAQLSSEEINKRTEALMSSDKVVNSVKALAHPFALASGLTMLLSAAYYIIPTKKWGMTAGKRIARIVVRDLDGGKPDWWQTSIRYFAFIGLGAFGGVVTLLDLTVNKAFLPSNPVVNGLSIILSQATWILSVITIIMIFARVDRRGLHDQLAHTIVRDNPKVK